MGSGVQGRGEVAGAESCPATDAVVPFVYAELPGFTASVEPDWLGGEIAEPPAAAIAPPPAASPVSESALREVLEARIAVESQRDFEAGRIEGREQAATHAREEAHAALTRIEEERCSHAAELAASFGRERNRYLARVEEEVVALALAVSARILRREAQMDPLLLTGAVRVALGQLGGSSRVRLRVPAADRLLWAEAVSLIPNLALRPEVEGVPEMRLGDCVIESDLGRVDLGIRAQLAEIERGFFDRPAGGLRPAADPAEARP